MTAAAPLPDAAPTNWVDRLAPIAARPWLKLGRFDRPAGVWLLMLPGWQGIALAAATHAALPDVGLLLLFAVGAILMRAAGCAFNDIVDRDMDARVARTAARPVAAGQISVKGAWGFVIACCLTSVLILLSLNLVCVVLGVASLGLVAAYPFMKRITWWPQAWLGLTFNWGALMGFAAAYNPRPFWAGGASVHLGAVGVSLPLLLYAGGVAWTLGYDTIYAVQDLEDDALAGVKSSARRLGAAAPQAVLAFYLAAIALALSCSDIAGLGPVFPFVVAIYGAHLIWQSRRLKLDDPAGALALFKSNRDAGLVLFLAMMGGSWRAPARLFGLL
jgi:4-hydroxybenzoate polyprenyltransferase